MNYTVQTGDNLWKIVRNNYQYTENNDINKVVNQIVKDCELSNGGNIIHTGQVLTIPDENLKEEVSEQIKELAEQAEELDLDEDIEIEEEPEIQGPPAPQQQPVEPEKSANIPQQQTEKTPVMEKMDKSVSGVIAEAKQNIIADMLAQNEGKLFGSLPKKI